MGLVSVAERVRKYGLRVTCLRCRSEIRHRPHEGRLRFRRCAVRGCGGRFMPTWQLESPRYETRALVAIRAEQQRSRVFDIA